MGAKTKKQMERQRRAAANRAAKMRRPGEESKYARKRKEQLRGKFRPTSPFCAATLADGTPNPDAAP